MGPSLLVLSLLTVKILCDVTGLAAQSPENRYHDCVNCKSQAGAIGCGAVNAERDPTTDSTIDCCSDDNGKYCRVTGVGRVSYRIDG